MSILKILNYPDNRLRKIAKSVTDIDNTIHIMIDSMFETMYFNEGIGLAATQIDVHLRIIVIDISKNRNQRLVLINPELLNESGETGIDEGCLSIPNQRGFVPRSETINIQSLNCNNESFQLEANGLLSICIQHEMDHLIGKLFIDKALKIK